jgi:hypothetical protein
VARGRFETPTDLLASNGKVGMTIVEGVAAACLGTGLFAVASTKYLAQARTRFVGWLAS